MIKSYLPFVFLCLALVGCLPNEPTFDNFRRDEIRYILSNRSEKAWLVDERIVNNELVELQACDSARQLIFKFSADTKVRDSLFYINRAPQCADSTIVQAGFWYVPTNTKPTSTTDTLVFVWQGSDTNYYRINDISPVSFQIESFLRSAPFQETFILPDSDDL
jgi:hypothetical protein